MIQFIHIYKSSIKYFLQCLTRNHDMNIWNWNTIRESFKKKGNGKFHGENQREVIKEQLQNSFLDSSFITLFKELQQDGGPSDLLNLSTLYNHCCGDQHHPLQISEDNISSQPEYHQQSRILLHLLSLLHQHFTG